MYKNDQKGLQNCQQKEIQTGCHKDLTAAKTSRREVMKY